MNEANKNLTCGCCGEELTGLPLDVSIGYPDRIMILSDEDKTKYVAKPCQSLMSWRNKEFFVRGIIELPILETEDKFCYGAWVQVSKKDYKKFLKAWVKSKRNDETVDEHIYGFLACMMPPNLYPDAYGLNSVICDRPDKAAGIVLEPTEHPLALEQRQGITMDRVHEMVRTLGYKGNEK